MSCIDSIDSVATIEQFNKDKRHCHDMLRVQTKKIVDIKVRPHVATLRSFPATNMVT